MRKIIIYIVIAILIVSELLLFKTNCSLREELILKNAENINLVNINAALKPQFAAGIKNVGQHLYNFILKDISGNTISIKEQIRSMGERVLICRISENFCDECVEYAINKIENLKMKYKTDNIMILSKNESQNTFRMYINKFELLHDAKIFQCQSFGIPADNIMTPFCIAVDSTLEVLGIYVPQKTAYNRDLDSLNTLNINMLYNQHVYMEIKTHNESAK